MFKFEDLRVYQDSLLFCNEIYTVSQTFPKSETFGLTDQMRRAAVSITLNIAEGTSRTKKDFRHFLDIARGSCYECIAILAISKNQKYITEQRYNELYERLNILSKKINALKSSLL